MDDLPDDLRDEFDNYEATIEPNYLTLIVSTTDSELRTYTFSTKGEGRLELESQTSNGEKVDDGVSDAVERLLSEHPVIAASHVED